MADPIPQEDDITKTQLWQRIDYTREVIESHKGDIFQKLDTVVEDLKSQLITINSDQMLAVHKKLGEVDDALKNFKVAQSDSLVKTIQDIQGLFKAHLGDVEVRIKALTDSIPDTVKSDASTLFSDCDRRLIDVETKSAKLAEDLNKALSDYQVETRTKVGGLRTRVEKIVTQLRDGFQDL